ncbi:hypothetical protein C2G38_2224776 [Gigaspora rosea]|uniref:Uncharacterized protein n=1 Tax=Gigaspora rosea TaxID=44941 RepID=A0A397U008_9GLOM|nr:hypothetical protein C2G38_2224776 [Gigaspora rosea]
MVGKCSGCGFTPRTAQNASHAENATSEQNQVPVPKGDLISFDENLLMHQPIEARELAVDPGIGSSSKQNNLKETTIEAYKRINKESEAITEKTNRQVDIRKSGSYILTSLKLFSKTTLAPKRSEKIDKKENAWLNLASTDISLVEKWNKFPYGIFKATIEGNPLKKSLQCTRYLRYNLYGIYIHFDLESAKRNSLKVYLLDESPNALIYEKNTCVSGSDMFSKWGNILYNIKKEGRTTRKISKALLVSLWGVLCEQRNGQNYGDQVKRIYTDSFIVAGKVELKTGIEMGELKFEKKGVCVVKNCILVTWKLSYPEIPNLITNNLPDFEKIQQDKEQLIVKRKLSKKSDINLPNEIIIEIFQHLRTQIDRLGSKESLALQCGNNELFESTDAKNFQGCGYKLDSSRGHELESQCNENTKALAEVQSDVITKELEKKNDKILHLQKKLNRYINDKNQNDLIKKQLKEEIKELKSKNTNLTEYKSKYYSKLEEANSFQFRIKSPLIAFYVKMQKMKLFLMDMDEANKHVASRCQSHPASPTWPFKMIVIGKSGSDDVKNASMVINSYLHKGKFIVFDLDRPEDDPLAIQLKFDTLLDLQKEIELWQKRKIGSKNHYFAIKNALPAEPTNSESEKA